ncbi:MAG: iron ABC transporter substrate-binding protein [Desulfobacter sp.]|nr:MAG: iron ABC transporter substrate-binding protein [Desulfobacter sp.]
MMIALSFQAAGTAWAGNTVVDAMGRSKALPDRVDRIICSGPGCLRLVAYLQAGEMVVAVDDIEGRKQKFDARPYALANPAYRSLPVFGGFRGQDDPEKILGLDPSPQVIFKTYPTMGHDPVELENKTGIPVVALDYGDLGPAREKLFSSLTLMGRVIGREARAAEVIRFFEDEILALEGRTRDIPEKKTCYIGGVAFKGPHGFVSTEPFYPPFEFGGGLNIAGMDMPLGKQLQQSLYSKEKLLTRDPDVIFLDLSTLQMGEGHGGLFELKTDPVFRALTAVGKGEVYGTLPYNWYTQNFGSILADAWFAGKTLYPERFRDVDPAAAADRIYTFLLGAPVFDAMNRQFRNLIFTRLAVEN